MATYRELSEKSDLLALLEQDHRKVESAFQDYRALGNRASKKKLADEICRDLLRHAQLEEEIFYPVFRKAVNDGDHLANEAQVAHNSAKDLIHQIQAMDGGEDLFDAKVTVLAEYVRHHIKQEEKTMFPALRGTNIDLHRLAGEMDRLETGTD